jgi:DNA polymerase-3 subunit beta
MYFITDKNIAKSRGNRRAQNWLWPTYPYEGKFQVPSASLFHEKGLTDIIKLLSDEHSNIGLYYDKDNKIIGIKCENTKMNIKLVDSKFPPYEQVIPQYKDNKVVIPKEEFLQALKRISLLFDTSDSGVILNVEKDRITMSGIDTIKGKGREEIEVIIW